jgi:hypothetical protein
MARSRRIIRTCRVIVNVGCGVYDLFRLVAPDWWWCGRSFNQSKTGCYPPRFDIPLLSSSAISWSGCCKNRFVPSPPGERQDEGLKRSLDPLSPALGNCSMRCPTSRFPALVSRMKSGTTAKFGTRDSLSARARSKAATPLDACPTPLGGPVPKAPVDDRAATL